MAQQRGELKGFSPVYNAACKVLVLGSYPSPQSFEEGFYYGHPRNRFWPLLAALTGCEVPHSIQEKKALLLGHHIALWDSLERCRIIGAADSSIQDPVPNDIAGLLRKTSIEAVFCNGAASHAVYTRFCLPATGLAAQKLPSTSPANAAWGLPRLVEAWAPLTAYWEGPAGG